jgi:hypothetical protein
LYWSPAASTSWPFAARTQPRSESTTVTGSAETNSVAKKAFASPRATKRSPAVVAVFVGVGLNLFLDECFETRIGTQKPFDRLALCGEFALLTGNLNLFELS